MYSTYMHTVRLEHVISGSLLGFFSNPPEHIQVVVLFVHAVQQNRPIGNTKGSEHSLFHLTHPS